MLAALPYSTTPTSLTVITVNWTRNSEPGGTLVRYLRFQVSCNVVLLPSNNYQNKTVWCSLHFIRSGPKAGKIQSLCNCQ